MKHEAFDGVKQMIDRRKMFALLGAAGATALFPTVGNAAPQQQEGHHPTAGEPPPVSPGDALARLKEGNRRFVSGQSRHAHESASLRHQLVSGQHPFATVLGCSDSRVPVELIFDQGIGDLFVIRVAGNVITDDVLGSIEYARIHLNSQLLVILGHEGCGAVTAALEARKHASSDPHGVQTIVKLINPAIGNIEPGLPVSEQVHRAVELNVRRAQEELKNLPETRDLPLSTVGAVYDLEGTVRWLN
jgi:carbonic anhydrase